MPISMECVRTILVNMVAILGQQTVALTPTVSSRQTLCPAVSLHIPHPDWA